MGRSNFDVMLYLASRKLAKSEKQERLSIPSFSVLPSVRGRIPFPCTHLFGEEAFPLFVYLWRHNPRRLLNDKRRIFNSRPGNNSGLTHKVEKSGITKKNIISRSPSVFI
jgi:hypothetical protein